MQQLASQFLLRPGITYLNYGSFGACVRPVFERYQQYQLELEQEPVQFMTITGPQYLAQSRAALGAYIGCAADDVVYVTNPSYAVNTIAKSLGLKAGDEVLSTNIEYGACDRTWDYYCTQAGATYKRQLITLPLQSKDEFVAQFMAGVTAKTRLVFISHITSATGLRLPVEEVCTAAKALGIATFVDGAHAPGQVPVNLQTLRADYYTGACHKWMLSPKGSSFLYVKRELQAPIDPLVISWGYKAMFPSSSRFIDYHQLNGSRDFSAFISVPSAIEFMRQNNWDSVAAQYRHLTQQNAVPFYKLLNTQPLAPLTDDFIRQLFSAEIKTATPEKLQRHLYEDYHIEIPVMRQGDKVYLRYSLNAFNTQADMDKLFDALTRIKATTNFIEQ